MSGIEVVAHGIVLLAMDGRGAQRSKDKLSSTAHSRGGIEMAK